VPELNFLQTPFFVVGTGRCGTSMFRKLLKAHKNVHLPRETHWIPVLFNSFGWRSIPHQELLETAKHIYLAKGFSTFDLICKNQKVNPDKFSQDILANLPGNDRCTVKDFMQTVYALAGKQQQCEIIGDKTPDYGLCMTLIQSLWPDAKFIHVYRDGRDVALSMTEVMSFRLLAAWQINHWWALSFKKLYEAKLPEAQEEIPIERFFWVWHSRIMRTFDEASRLAPGSYMPIRYERILNEPEAILEEVGNFLDFTPDDEWIPKASSIVVRGNINKNLKRPEYKLMTEKFRDELLELGFAP
jgi:hypothetical protein